MASPLAVSPFLVGDPVRLGDDVTSFAGLVAALDVPFLEQAGLLELAPGVALIHALAGAGGRLALRWVHLPHGPRFIAGAAPIETAVVLTAPITESARALRVTSRLMTYVQDATLLVAARAADSREALVRALAPLEQSAAECSLPTAGLLALLGSSPSGLSAEDAARRHRACGPNQIERTRRRYLLARLLEQFWSFFAVLLWVAGARP